MFLSNIILFTNNILHVQRCNHKHVNKLNNNISNLEFVTNKENQIHKMGLGNNHTRKIGQYDEKNILIKELETSIPNIRGVLKKKENSCGFLFGNI